MNEDVTGEVGNIGLGIMGGAYVRNILAKGGKVIGFDIDADRMAELAGEGMQPATSAKDVADRASVVITSLPTPGAFHGVLTGEAGVIETTRSGLIVADTCTLSIDDKTQAHDALAAKGVTLLDCPVSGTGAQAAAGDLSIFASGDEAACRAVAPVFDMVSHTFTYIGPFGDGSKMKYVANLLVAIHNASAAEAMVLGQKAGLDRQLMLDVLSSGAGSSRMMEIRGPMMVSGDYTSNVTATMTLQAKDMGIIKAFADSHDCPTPLFSTTHGYYRDALDQGLADSDTASICAVMESAAGVKRRG